MRVTTNVSDDLVVRIDNVCEKIGCTRSSLLAILVGQGLIAYEKSLDLIDSVSAEFGYDVKNKLFENLDNEVTENEKIK